MDDTKGKQMPTMTNDEIAHFFNTTRAFIQANPNLRDSQVDGWLEFSCFRGHQVLWIGDDHQSKDERTISVRAPLAEGGTGARRRIWHGSSSPWPRPSLIQGGV